jgi:WS/DGAT/MGAT family acyltransferase
LSNKNLNRRLSSIDAAFLYSENETAPMHIGGLEVIEGQLNADTLTQKLDSKLHLVPRYRQILARTPFALAHPTWEDDTTFDAANHVETITLPAPGSESQFQEMASALFEGVLNRTRPLWKMVVIEGREDGNTGLLWKVHHAMVDGVSGAEILQVLFDIKPNAESPEKPAYEPSAKPTQSQLMRDGAWDALEDGFTQSAQLRRKTAELARTANTKEVREQRREYPKLMRDLARPLMRLPFNKYKLSGKRQLSWSYCSFAEVRGIRSAQGGTVNDVILTALAGGVRKYMEAHNIPTRRKMFRAACPVSLRSKDQSGALGNQVSMMPVDVDMTSADPIERLQKIAARTALLKKAKVPQVLDLFSQMWQGTHASFQALTTSAMVSKPLAELAQRFAPRPAAHMICTNVPGPQVPLYAAGHKVLHHYPLLPVAPSMGLSMGVFSYNQRIYFGYIADQLAISDVDFFRDCVDQAFSELRIAAGVPETEFVELRHPEPGKTKAIDEKTAAEILKGAKRVEADPAVPKQNDKKAVSV